MPSVRHDLNQPELFAYIAVKNSEDNMLFTISAENALKEMSARHLRNSIFIASVEFIDESERNEGTKNYMLTDLLLTKCMEKGGIQVIFALRRGAWYVWLVILGAMIPWKLVE